MDPQRSGTPSVVANELVGLSIVTVTVEPSVTVIEVIAAFVSSLNVTVLAVEAEHGSVTTMLKLTWSLTVFTLKVDEPAGPLEATVIVFVK